MKNHMSTRICEYCNRNPAMYVCKTCGKTACESCFNPYVWKCQDCSKGLSVMSSSPEEVVAPGWRIAPTIFPLAFFIIFVGMMLMVLASVLSGGGTGSSGLVVFIGPFPIAIGTGPQSSLMVVVAFALAIVGMLVLFLFTRRRPA